MCAAPIGNKFAIGNEGGRPPMYKTTEELMSMCDSYFEYIQGEFHHETKLNPKTGKEVKTIVWDREPEPATITGLALYLGFESRQSFYDYEKKNEFTYYIKRSRLKVEYEYEKRLNSKEATGAIFGLKQMGWADKQEVDHTTKGEKISITPIEWATNGNKDK